MVGGEWRPWVRGQHASLGSSSWAGRLSWASLAVVIAMFCLVLTGQMVRANDNAGTTVGDITALGVRAQASGSAIISIDVPQSGQRVGGPLVVAGWAADPASASGTGVEEVHVYADGEAGRGTPVGVAEYGSDRQDVAGSLGSARFAPSGFMLSATSATLGLGQHTLYVYARTSAGWTYKTVTFTVAAVPGGPDARATGPSDLTIGPIAGGTVTMRWNPATAGPVDSYNIYQSTDGINFRKILSVPGVALSALVGGMATGGTYHFYVTAMSGGVESTPSNTSSPGSGPAVQYAGYSPYSGVQPGGLRGGGPPYINPNAPYTFNLPYGGNFPSALNSLPPGFLCSALGTGLPPITIPPGFTNGLAGFVGQPTGLTVTTVGSTTVSLTWVPPAGSTAPIISYTVWISRDCANFTPAVTVGPGVPTATLSTLARNTSFFVFVTADTTNNQRSLPSNVVPIMTTP